MINRVRQPILTLGFALLIALGARLNVPMVPVPMTMQTFAVLLAGAVLGPFWGTAAVLVYLAMAALGLPVLSDGASGLAPFAGPTAGYIAAFPVAAFLAGTAVRKGWLDRRPPATAFLSGLHLLILALGTFWLGRTIGLAEALQVGFAPFLAGAVVKSFLVAVIWAPLRRVIGA